MIRGVKEQDLVMYLTSILSCIGDGIIVTNRSGVVLYMNNSAEILTEWPAEEAVGMDFDLVFPLVNYYTGYKLNGPIQRVLKEDQPVGLQNHSALRTKSGKRFFVSAVCSPFYNRRQNLEGMVVSFRNIERIKSIEEGVRREKNNLNNVLESLPIGTVVVEQDLKVHWANKPLLDLFQLEEKDLIGKSFGKGFDCYYQEAKGCCSLSTGEKFCDIIRNMQEVFESGVGRQDVVAEHAFIRDEKKITLWLKTSFVPLAASDSTRVLVVFEDITEQRQYETALKKSRDEAASASRIKSEFIANMSHEIRTPLNGLIGMLDLLLQIGGGEEQIEYIRMAKLSADNLLKVISDILDFSKIEAGKLLIKSIPFDLRNLVHETLKIHDVLARKKDLKLTLEMDYMTDDTVIGDPDRLRQILNNLIGNAIKFTDRGRISVIVRIMESTAKTMAVRFSVSDTGIGIAPDKMDYLFERFSQGDGSFTKRHAGTGLGLAISKQLAELMNGNISAESKVGEGSTFLLDMTFQIGRNNKAEANSIKEPEEFVSLVITEEDDSPKLSNYFDRNVDDGALLNMSPDSVSRIRLSENGDIIYETAPQTEDLEKEQTVLPELAKRLESLLEKGDYRPIERMAHEIKQKAFLTGAYDLADLAFRTELASRKQKWDEAAKYSGMMIKEIYITCREG